MAKEQGWQKSKVDNRKGGQLEWASYDVMIIIFKHTLIKGRKKWRPRRLSPNQPRAQGVYGRDEERRHRRA